tara:strand:- start:44593 stop:45819 length:1227 start_codon:yes stop_codon:yes gene_type:complete
VGREIDQTAKTGLAINSKDWNPTKQQVRPKALVNNRDFINSKLNQLQTHIYDEFTLANGSGAFITRSWLKETIESFFGRVVKDQAYKIYFSDWVKNFIEENNRLNNGKPLAKTTLNHYKNALAKIEKYQEYKNTKYKFEEIDLTFYRGFVSFLKSKQQLTNNTIGGVIKRIKLFCKNVELEGLPINQQYKHSEFSAITNETQDVYLNETEIDLIFHHDFTGNPRLDNVRDLFIIGLRTGLRVSDFLKLKDFNFSKNQIDVVTVKTGQRVIIPMHPQIKEVLEKRNGALPKRISDQKFNDYVKDVCEAVGIKDPVQGAKINPETKRKEAGIYPKFELISSHTCRRSFATNLYGKLPNLTIMAITGHTTESVFLKYVKLSKTEHAQKLAGIWANEPKEAKPLNPILKAVK